VVTLLTLEIVAGSLLQLVRLLFGSAFWCAVAQIANARFGVTQTSYVVSPGSFATSPILHVAAAGEETIVIALALGSGRDDAFYREIARVGPAGMGEPVRVRIPATPRSGANVAMRGSDGFFVTGKDWWYATLDNDRDGAAATTFVKSDGSRATYVRPPAAVSLMSWQMTVIPGEKPRALEFTYNADETIVREVDWNGASRSWRLPPVSYQRISNMVAEPLPDGRIALLDNHSGLSMYLLTDEGHVDAITLRNVQIQQFDVAIDHAGRIVIVAARNAIVQARGAVAAASHDTGTIDAAVIDPANPDQAEWRPLRHDVRVTGSLRELHVVNTPDGFAAAWINELDGMRIEATDVDPRGHGGPVVEVGRASPGAPLDLQATHDELLFWWDDGKHLFQRRLPVSLKDYAGYTIVSELAQGICGKAEAHHE
jgi:hypothetical protein